MSSAIYDLGYQRYSGERLSRWYMLRTLTGFSLRTAFGLGRGDKAKTLPVLVATVVFLPALIQVVIASQTGVLSLINYANHLELTAVLLALFAAGQAPELIVADRQQGILTLYLARPLRSTDYAWSKLAALFIAMLILTLGPQFLMFVGRVFAAKEPWPEFLSEWPKLFPIVAGSALVSLFFAALGLSLSSLTTRRGYASAAVISFFLLTAAFSQIIQEVGFGGVERYAVLANPALLVSGFAKWLFEIEASRRSTIARVGLEGEYYLWTLLIATTLACAIFVNRYRRMDA